MNVTGCIVTYNNMDTIERCLSTLLRHSRKYGFELFVVDNGSADGTPELIQKKYPQIRLILNRTNAGFGAGHNAVLSMLSPDGYHFVINPDIYIDQDVAADMVDFLESKGDDAAMCTPMIRNPDGSEQKLPQREPRIRYVMLSKFPCFSYLRREYTGEPRRQGTPYEIHFCTGCFFCIKNHVLKEMGGFDERFFMYFEDADLSRRVNQKYRIFFYPHAVVFHEWKRENTRSAAGRKRFLHSMGLYFNKWGWKF